MKIPLVNELESGQNILIAGAGGGFDVFCGLPLYFWLKNAGRTVHLANLSSGALGFCEAENPASALWRIGEMLCYRAHAAQRRLAENNLPAGPWFHTDDTEMAISIVAVLQSYGHLHQDALAKRFARRFERDPDRGYGSMTRIQMRQIAAGVK